MHEQLDPQRLARVRELSSDTRSSGNHPDALLLDDLLAERDKMIEWLHEVVIRLGRHPKLADDHDPTGDGLIPQIQRFLGITDKIT